MTIECPECNGTQHDRHNGGACSWCGGYGQVGAGPAIVREVAAPSFAPCPHCGGRGGAQGEAMDDIRGEPCHAGPYGA